MKFIRSLGIIVTLLIAGCGNDKESITTIDHPELIAVAFFDALYNEKNIEKAASVCAPKLARVILHYQSTKAVARHLFNMSFDTVEIKPEDSGVKVREQFKNAAVITVYFNGMYNNEPLKDIKRISLIQQDDKWLIDEILKDPF